MISPGNERERESEASTDSHSDLSDQEIRQFDKMDSCREFYERRMQSLERFRQKIAYQSTADNDGAKSQYFQLQSDLVQLMENDVNLINQLMKLGERIDELKSLTTLTSSSASASSWSPNGVSPTPSLISLDGVYFEEEIANANEENENVEFPHKTQISISARIGEPKKETHQTVENCNEQNGKLSPTRVYFSRQNSILRIPIPPSRGLRSKTIADPHNQCGPHIVSILKRGGSSVCEASSSDDTSSCLSNASEYSRGQGWYTKKAGRDFLKCGSIAGKKHANDKESISTPCHISQGSCDSGVHHLNNSVDLFDGEDLIFV